MRCCYLHVLVCWVLFGLFFCGFGVSFVCFLLMFYFLSTPRLGWSVSLKWMLQSSLICWRKFHLFKYFSIYFFLLLLQKSLQLKFFFLFPFIALKSFCHGDWPFCCKRAVRCSFSSLLVSWVFKKNLYCVFLLKWVEEFFSELQQHSIRSNRSEFYFSPSENTNTFMKIYIEKLFPPSYYNVSDCTL